MTRRSSMLRAAAPGSSTGRRRGADSLQHHGQGGGKIIRGSRGELLDELEIVAAHGQQKGAGRFTVALLGDRQHRLRTHDMAGELDAADRQQGTDGIGRGTGLCRIDEPDHVVLRDLDRVLDIELVVVVGGHVIEPQPLDRRRQGRPPGRHRPVPDCHSRE